MDSQLLSIVILEWVDNSDSQSKNKPAQRSPNEPEETKIKPVTLCTYGIATKLAFKLVLWT